MEFQEKVDFLTNNGVDEVDLDDLVHKTKSEEATSINNTGFEEQLSYLLQAGWTIETIKQEVKS
jgi:beta-lactam-binding protein with PASTA domain